MFKIDKFLADHFRGPLDVLKIGRKAGFDMPPYSAVYKWFVRRSIPFKWFPVILFLAEKRGDGPISMVPYVKAAKPRSRKESDDEQEI